MVEKLKDSAPACYLQNSLLDGDVWEAPASVVAKPFEAHALVTKSLCVLNF